VGGRNHLAVLAEVGREGPAAGEVADEGVGLILSEDVNPEKAGVDEIREDEVDQSVLPGERHRRLGPAAGERLEALPFPAGEDEGLDVVPGAVHAALQIPGSRSGKRLSRDSIRASSAASTRPDAI